MRIFRPIVLPRISSLGFTVAVAATVTTTFPVGGCKKGDSGKEQAKEADPGGPTPTKAKPEQKAGPKLPAVSAAKVLEKAKPIFGKLPEKMTSESNPITDAKVELGRMLYHDARLSKNQDISCASCHDLKNYGIDVRAPDGNRKTSQGHKGRFGKRNSPTSYNAAMQVAQFWDGRAPTVEEQAKGPILNPEEMAMPDEASTLAVVKSIPGYAEPFKTAFPDDEDPITYDNIGKAIGAFERTLVTPSKFDDFLGGQMGALSQDELRGLELFIDTGCITCHTGPGVGGGMFQKLGVVKPYETDDLGRYEVTKSDADKYVFKVPTLRNVAKTGPYLHDGSIEKLGDVVQIMAEHQLAKGKLSEPELKSMLAFLDALTGELPAAATEVPDLPESGPETPKPDPT